MNNPRFSQEEFDMLFPGPFESEQERRREYHAFLDVLGQLDQAPVPELSARQRAEIFRRAWSAPSEDRSWVGAILTFLKQPAVTFALGIALGCALMLAGLNATGSLRHRLGMASSAEPSPGPESLSPSPGPVEPLFTVERSPYTRTYGGKVLQGLYPQIENPKLVVERARESSTPQRVVYGTLDGGEVYVAWNL